MVNKDLDKFLAKLKVTNSYPRMLPKTNAKIISEEEVEYQALAIDSDKLYSVIVMIEGIDDLRAILDCDKDFIDFELAFSEYGTPPLKVRKLVINDKTFIYHIDSLSYCSRAYLSDDLIHILILDDSCMEYAFIALFKIDDFSLYSEKIRIKRSSEYPIFNIDSSQEDGVIQVGVFEFCEDDKNEGEIDF